MSNPFFSRSAAFNGRGPVAAPDRSVTPNGYPAMPGYQPGQYGRHDQYDPVGHDRAPAGHGAPGRVPPEQLAGLEDQYAAPSATNVDRGRMTYDDVIIRAAGMLAVIVGVGAVTWHLATDRATAGAGPVAMTVGAVGALVLGIVNSVKREPSPMLILAYAVFEGAVLGALSGVMEYAFPGIVLQAVLATCATFAVVLCAYKLAGFRVRGRAVRVLLVAMGGYLLFSLVNLALMVTGVVSDPWGLRGLEVMGIPLGLIIGAVAVLMAAFSLAMDFEAIQRGVGAGLPTRYAWAGAFGLVVTIVWLYVEFLRILAILHDE